MSTLTTILLLFFTTGQDRDPVRIHFSILDKDRRPVLGLTEKDFSLRIDNWPAQMQNFRAGRDSTDRTIPLVAWILLDFNPMIESVVITNQAEAAKAVFERLHPDSAFGVQLVSDHAETLVPLSRDPEAVRKAFIGYAVRRNELRVNSGGDSVWLGPGGILRATEIAIDELDRYIASRATLQEQEVRRVILILSDGNINPSYNKKNLYRKATKAGVYLYPIFIPRKTFGSWANRYFDLAKKTGGLATIFGALNPQIDLFRLPRGNKDPNALTFNFLNIIRDLNGKYSFTVPEPLPGKKTKLKLKSTQKKVTLLLPRSTIEMRK